VPEPQDVFKGLRKVLSFILQSELKNGQALVAHTCNPSYSGGRDQEDYGLKTV
jgi:hypothetical protein